MLSQRFANLIFVTAIIIGCGYFAWVAQGFTTSGLLASAGLPSKFFPQLMLALTALCALIVGYAYLVHGQAGGDIGQNVFTNSTEARQGILMLIVAVACYLIWRYLGFLPMAFLIGPLSLLAMGIFKPAIYAVVWGLTIAVTLIFTYGLGIGLI